jgi:hypothetical protein
MKRIVLTVTALLLSCTFDVSSARADNWSGYFTITALVQNTDHTLVVFPSTTTGIPTGICTSEVIGQFYLPATNGTYPSYNSLAPILTAAYLFGKTVSVNLISGCTGWNVPIIAGVTVLG